jgi:hypothetical protein
MTVFRKRKPSSKKPKTKHFYTGKRRTVHLKLPKSIQEGLRVRAKQKDVFSKDVWDEVCEWFLTNAPPPGSRAYEHPDPEAGYTTVWIATPLLEKLEKLGERDDVSRARVLHTAAARYLAKNEVAGSTRKSK